jgi:hypothetical protein
MSHAKTRLFSWLVVAVGSVALLTGRVASAQCFGDCNGDGQLTAGDLTKIKCIILNCASAAPGCAACANAPCTAADSNLNGLISAGELTHAINNILTFLNPPKGCPPGPSSTPTVGGGTPTPTPTSTNTPGTAVRLCGNGVVDPSPVGTPGEECDDGGTCIGGTNAGTHCTAEADCMGSGVCAAGANLERVCNSDADCPESTCIHCKTFGGDGCAANCTLETTINGTLVPGAPVSNPAPGTSSAVVRTDGVISNLPLALSGTTIQIYGKERNGFIPFVQPSTGVKFPAIKVGTVACACVRAVAFKTCGGTIFEADGSPATNCTPTFTQGDSVCAGKNPCTFVHGPGNATTGLLGCNGLSGTNLLFAQDAGGQPPYPPAPTPPVGSGPPMLTLGDECDCTGDTNCGAGQTCNLSGPNTGRCTCSADADCPQADLVGVGVCPRNCVGGSVPGSKCTSDGDCLGGTCPVGSCIPSVCSPTRACPAGQACTASGPGAAIIVSSTAIGQVVPPTGFKPNVCNVSLAPTPNAGTAPYGADKIFCYHCSGGTSNGAPCTLPADCPGGTCIDDDPEGCVGGTNAGHPCSTDNDCPGGACVNARGSVQTLPIVSGTATGVVTNAWFQGTNTVKSLGPFSIVGGKANCQALAQPTPSTSGTCTAGAFDTLNQPQLVDAVVTNLLCTQ